MMNSQRIECKFIIQPQTNSNALCVMKETNEEQEIHRHIIVYSKVNRLQVKCKKNRINEVKKEKKKSQEILK